MAALQYIFNAIVNLYIIVIFVSVILSWLIHFNVVNGRNQFVSAVGRTCYALTEPLLRPIRSILPSLGGLDISPIILLIGINALQIGVNRYIFMPMIMRGL
ncbi:MAG: YggT family protein [Pseudomonadota bacterium]|nr:YggT family protein [Pseudomonadota bacterium]